MHGKERSPVFKIMVVLSESFKKKTTLPNIFKEMAKFILYTSVNKLVGT